MSYSAQSDLENLFGTANVAAWSNLEGGTDADTDRIAAAIAWADAYIDDRFRPCGIYSLPFSGTSPIVTNWSASLAGIWLFQSRPTGGGDAGASYADKREQVEREIDLYIIGGRRLTCTRAESKNANVPYVVPR